MKNTPHPKTKNDTDMKNHNIIILAAAILSFTLAACMKTVIEDYIHPSVRSYTFTSDEGTYSIEINASSDEWQAEGWDETWLQVETDQASGTITLTAQANSTGSIRETTVTLACGTAEAGITVSQFYEGFNGLFVDMREFADKPVFSKNGKYYATYDHEYLEDGNTAVKYPLIINAETGETTRLEGSTEYTDVKAVNNDGTMLSIGTSLSCVVFKNGEKLSLEIPGYKNINVEGFNGDGSIMVGYAQESEGRKYMPVKWNGLEPELLQIPEENMNGMQLRNGAMARGCSEDGSVVYGSEWDTQGVVYWKNGEMKYIAKETAIARTTLVPNMFTGELDEVEDYAYLKKNAERYCISPNGRYIACTFYDFYTDESGSEPSSDINYPALVDTETGEAILFDKAGFMKSMGTTASNDGTLFGNTTDFGDPQGYVFTKGSSSGVPVGEWMMSEYGIITDNNRYVMNISADNNTVSGWRVESSATGTTYRGWYYIGE